MGVYLVERPPDPPAAERARSPVASVVVWVLVVLLFAGTGALTLSAILGETGVGGFVVGAVLAAVPVVPVVATFLWLDRYEAEPRALLLFAFGWGAAVATLVSLVVNTASISALTAAGGDPTAAAVFVAPVVEESAKGLAVVGVLLLRRREFDGVIDGIVYAGMAGIGFAAVENVLYLGRALLEEGGTGTVAVFVVRCLFSPFAHPLFTIAFGIGVGVAVRTRRWPLRLVAPLLGWSVAGPPMAPGTCRPSLACPASSRRTCCSRCPCSWASSSSPCWPGGAKPGSCAGTSRRTRLRAGCRRESWRCSPRCPSAAERWRGPRTAGAGPGPGRCASSRGCHRAGVPAGADGARDGAGARAAAAAADAERHGRRPAALCAATGLPPRRPAVARATATSGRKTPAGPAHPSASPGGLTHRKPATGSLSSNSAGPCPAPPAGRTTAPR